MKPKGNPDPAERQSRIAALVRSLQDAERELQELTRGELDAVATEGLRYFLPSEAHEKLRTHAAALQQAAEIQSGILNALPAHIALLDDKGVIIAVNESWRRFGSANVLQSEDFYVGQNYLSVCDRAHGDCSDEAAASAEGIRQVLRGEAPEYSLEYPCHSPTEKRWFRVMVTPVSHGHRTGAVVMHVNVTQRRMAEEAIREQEAAQRRLAEELTIETRRLHESQAVANVGSWETDAATLDVTWTAETYRIFETTPDQFQPTHAGFLQFVHPDDRQKVADAFASSLARLGPFSIEHRLLLPSGKIKHIEERWQAFHDEAGKPMRAVGTCQDITQRKHAERAVTISEASLARAQRIARMGNWDWNIATGELSWSAQIFELFGIDPSRAIGTYEQFINGVHPDDRERTHQAVVDAVEGRAPYNVEHRVLWPDGTVRVMQEQGEVMRDASGRALNMVGTVQDITERKQADAQLREQADLLNHAQDAILVRDLDNRIHYWNKSAERLYGWNAAEVVGQLKSDLLNTDVAAVEAAQRELMAKGEWTGELVHKRKDGESITVEARWTLMCDAEGKPRSVLAINTDVTHRKRLEAQFLRAQRMESIGTLAGGIAHDLNNVLTPIMMSIGLLQMTTSDKESLEVLATIAASAKRGAEMVSQVLSFARGMDGRRIEVQVRHVLDDVAKIARDTFPKDIRIETRLDPNVWTLAADPTQLHQVLLNLCVNARDAMPHGGKISLGAKNLTVDAHYAAMNEAKVGPYVKIDVEDSGSGIPQEIIGKIFDPFFTTKEIGKGTGLGLSTSLAIVKSHGGFIQVYSEPGNGTRFSINLPAHTVAGGPEEVGEPTEFLRGRGETVLVIDDEASVREITKQTLEAFGYRALLASDGAEGLVQFVTHRSEIAVVLTDMMMPVMDGPATIHALLRIDPNLRIIAASGITANGNVAKAANAVITEFLPKPYTAETLLRALAKALHGKKQ